MNEIEWIIELKEFPNYFISSKGRIFNNKFGTMREFKGSIFNNGYLCVKLCKNNKTIHRLVGETFLKRVEGKNEIDHINQNKLDNRLENLRWVSKRENSINKGTQSNNTSGVKGVCFRKNKNTWLSRIQDNNSKTIRKSFKTKEEAIKWRKEMENKYYQIL